MPHPGAAGDCTDCHNPHASRQPGLPKTNAVDICLACHTDQAEQGKKHFLHQPAFKQGCATCHEPHGGDNDHLLRAKTCEWPLPGVSRTGFAAEEARSRARAHDFQRKREAARRLLHEE